MQTVLFCNTAYLPNLISAIHRSDFGRLCDANDFRLREVNIGASGDCSHQFRAVNLSSLTGDLKKLCAIRKEFGGSAFVGFYVSKFMTEDTVIGGTQ